MRDYKKMSVNELIEMFVGNVPTSQIDFDTLEEDIKEMFIADTQTVDNEIISYIANRIRNALSGE